MAPAEFITVELPGLRSRHPALRVRLKPGLVDPDAVRLSLIVIDAPERRGHGLGTAFMTDLIDACDRHRIGLELEIIDSDAAGRRRLEEFYRRFGMDGIYSEGMGMTFMHRSPAPEDVPSMP